MEHITGPDGPIAIILGADDHTDGSWFLTEPEGTHQLGVLSRPAGYTVPAHRHPPPTGTVEGDPVTLIVTMGRLMVAIEHAGEVRERSIGAGGAILLFAGEMTIEADEPAEYSVVRTADQDTPVPGS